MVSGGTGVWMKVPFIQLPIRRVRSATVIMMVIMKLDWSYTQGLAS
ncbi:hypothetical protein JOD67_003955 [Tenggerimyces flavus]|nr:hypothetical protein [Tenggerimyces flavus]